MSGSGMYGRLGGKYIVAMIMGPCGVLISTAIISDVKLLSILCFMEDLIAKATPSPIVSVLLDWYVVYVNIFICSVFFCPWLFSNMMCGSYVLYVLQSSFLLSGVQCSTLCCSTVRRESVLVAMICVVNFCVGVVL